MIKEIKQHEDAIKKLLENVKNSDRLDKAYYNKITYQINNHLEAIYDLASKDLSGQYLKSLRKRIDDSQSYYRELIYKIYTRKIVSAKLPNTAISEDNKKKTDEIIAIKQARPLVVGLKNFVIISYMKMLLTTDKKAKETKSKLDIIAESGHDLVLYHTDNTNCCDECTADEGTVFSISGDGLQYPPEIPRHPNCLCWYTVFIPKSNRGNR